jgi:hypothetical protein
MKRKFLPVCIVLLAFCFDAGAQNYSVDWHAIPGGGGASSNGQYSVTGSIGQSGAGSVMAGGNYSLAGGFWSLISLVQTPGAPALNITYLPNQVVVFWSTPVTNWTLQQNSNLAATGGWATSGYPVTATNGTSSITISAPTGNLFFRLSQP